MHQVLTNRSEQILCGSHGYVSGHLYLSFIQALINHIAICLKLKDIIFVKEGLACLGNYPVSLFFMTNLLFIV